MRVISAWAWRITHWKSRLGVDHSFFSCENVMAIYRVVIKTRQGKRKKQKCQCAHDARRQVRGSTNQYDSSSSDHVCTNLKAIHPIAVQRSESGPKLWNETRINIVLEQCPPPSWPEKFCHIPNSETSAVQAAGLLTLKPTDVRVRSPTIKKISTAAVGPDLGAHHH